MRLLHITATHLNLAGGVPVVLQKLVYEQNLIKGFEARVLSVNADISTINSSFFDYLGKKSFVEYIEWFKPDIVIFHSHYYFEYLRLYKVLVKKKIPYLIEPHGSFGTAALKKSKFKKEIANSILLKHYMKNAVGYIFLNEVEKSDSRFHSKVDLIIPNGIDKRGILHDYSEKSNCIFYFIGRFDVEHKGLDYLFDSLDLLEKEKRTYRIELFGTGNKQEIAYINNRIQHYSSLTVKNSGPVYGEEQAKKLEQCGVMLLVSRYEGFPMTVLEALKYGNPCLVTPGTNVANEISSNRLGWKTELDSAIIAQNINKAAVEYELYRKEYINRCKEYVEKKYSWDQIANQSYKQLLSAYNYYFTK